MNEIVEVQIRTFCLECKTTQWCKLVTNKVLCNKCIKKLSDTDYIEALKEVELIAPGINNSLESVNIVL